MVPVLSPDFEIETESSSEEEAVQEEVKKEEEDGPGLEALVKPAQAPVSVTPASAASLSQVGVQSCWNLHCHAAGLYGFSWLPLAPRHYIRLWLHQLLWCITRQSDLRFIVTFWHPSSNLCCNCIRNWRGTSYFHASVIITHYKSCVVTA